MGYNHQRIKSNAQLFYRNNLGTAIITPFLMTAVSGGAMTVLMFILYIPLFFVSLFSDTSVGIALFTLLIYPIIIAACIFFVNILSMGCVNWFRKSIHELTDMSYLFSGFKNNYISNVKTMGLKTLYIFLWTLLFYIPGYVKMYSYSMTEYLKDEFPKLSPSEAISLSMRITDGHKGDLFYLDLSFIGWFLLSSLTVNILGFVYVIPYYFAAKAFAYEELKAEAIANGKMNVEYM